MKKLNALNLGKSLTRGEMKSVNGGKAANPCKKNSDCGSGVCAHFETQTGSYPAGNYCL